MSTNANATDTAAVVPGAVRAALGDDVEVGKPWKLAGGAMHDSWAVDAITADGPCQLVVRVSPAGRADFVKTRREFEVLKVAHQRGIRCPRPIAAGEVKTGEDYLVMVRMPGDSNPRQLVASDACARTREAIIPQLAEDLARIHTITPADVAAAPEMRAPAPGEDPLAAARRQVEDDYHLYLLNPHPAIEWAFRWLDRRLGELPPSGREPCLVHGDFRVGNIMYDENGLTAILDWEGTHISEPEEELAWFCTRVWRFGANHLEAGGIARRDAWVEAYERASGHRVDRNRLAAWEVLQNIRWAQITMMQARAHLDGHTVSHELAAIGRRTAETELEILRLTGVAGRFHDAG